MKDIFITDSRKRYDQSKYSKRILYEDGLIRDCSFISKDEIEGLNDSLLGLENEAHRLMLQQLDADTKLIVDNGLTFNANRFISRLDPVEKTHSLLYDLHRYFVVSMYLFQLVLDRFFAKFNITAPTLHLQLSERYYLTKDITYDIKSASYSRIFNHVYLKFLMKQVAYFFYSVFIKKRKAAKTNIAIFTFDIPNGIDVFDKFIGLIQSQNRIKLTLVVIDSGNPENKKADISKYDKGNVNVVYLYKHKASSYSDYSSFYSVCEKLNPRYNIYKRSRFCEMQELQYGFTDSIISEFNPDVCIYGMKHDYGRILANVCAAKNIPSICVDYACEFDFYMIEKRIKYDIRACMSEVSSYNWRKHNDPTPRHEIVGFCKIDEWRKKLDENIYNEKEKVFNNGNPTILFISTYHPDPKSPVLSEKIKIVEQLSETCHQNNWNLIIKKHPAEFDTLADDVINRNNYKSQKLFQHHEMTLFDSIYSADFVCTQNSTAYIEALYLGKPFTFITLISDNVLLNASYFAKEKEVQTFSSVKEYERYILKYSEPAEYRDLVADFIRLQTKYLYKIDGHSSERLLKLVEPFIK